MSRKNTMLGLAALAAFGFAATSFAQCPSSPVPPWSAQTENFGALEIVSGGYQGTSCRLDASLTSNIGIASSFVRDNTPSAEPRYRAQFTVNVDNLTGLNLAQSVQLFAAATDTPVDGVGNIVRVTVLGNVSGTQKQVGIFTANSGGGTSSALLPLSAGENVIEFDWQRSEAAGGNGTLNVWVNNNNEASPTTSLTVDNFAWGGVDFAVLGLTGASPGFRAAQLNRTVGFDEFDSRRSTFIGY